MSACERCWDEAYVKMMTLGGSQADWYRRLLIENEDRHSPHCAGYEPVRAGADTETTP